MEKRPAPGSFQDDLDQRSHNDQPGQQPQASSSSFLPPPYSGPSSSAAPQATIPRAIQSIPQINYSLYVPPNFALSSDEVGITASTPDLCKNANYVRTFLQQQATIPPKLMIRVTGVSTGGHVDFDIRLNMLPFLYGREGDASRFSYIKTLDEGELGYRGAVKPSTSPQLPTLDAWVRRFCADDAAKAFVLERVVSNWDTAFLEGRLHSLVAATRYQGRVHITFPVTHAKVTIQSSFQTNGFAELVSGLFSGTRRYEVVRVVWPYATVRPGGEGRRYATVSEERWWEEWQHAIRHAVLSKRKGWVTVEDQMEFLMGREVNTGKAKQWGSGDDAESKWGIPSEWLS